MKKAVIAWTIIAALALSLAACGKARSAENAAPAAEPQTAASETAQPQVPETETEAQAASTMTAARRIAKSFFMVCILLYFGSES